MSPDLVSIEFGTFEAETAVRLFNSHSWEKELERFENAIRYHTAEYCDPDMTFSAPPSHFIAFIKNPDEFSVEVCRPRPNKLFCIFKRVKFYEFKSTSKSMVAELIKIFCMDKLEQKHNLFSSEVKSSAVIR